jgi:AraC-like DNA-binding protein
LSFTLLTVGDILFNSHLLLNYPHLFLVFDPLLFVLAPFSFFYVRSLTNNNWKFNAWQHLHFIPAVLLCFISLTVYFKDAVTKEKLILESYAAEDTSGNIILLIAALQIFIYLIINLKLIQLNAKNVKNFYSNQESVNLKWLKNFLFLNFILWTAFVVSTLLNLKTLIDISNILFTVVVYLIGYFGIKQPNIFFYQEIIFEEKSQDGLEKKKYASSSLSNELAERYEIELLELVQNEKIYLKNDLKLSDVAEKMKIQNHHLSQLLNNKLKKNFNDFINDYRVSEFKKRLTDNNYSNFTILAIGLDCGFNSKAAMNSIFKEHTGKSPTEYRKLNFSN